MYIFVIKQPPFTNKTKKELSNTKYGFLKFKHYDSFGERDNCCVRQSDIMHHLVYSVSNSSLYFELSLYRLNGWFLINRYEFLFNIVCFIRWIKHFWIEMIGNYFLEFRNSKCNYFLFVLILFFLNINLRIEKTLMVSMRCGFDSRYVHFLYIFLSDKTFFFKTMRWKGIKL